jgi:hypothetical protein
VPDDLRCPHCGGALRVLVPADQVDLATEARDQLIGAITDWSNAQSAMVLGIGLGKALGAETRGDARIEP